MRQEFKVGHSFVWDFEARIHYATYDLAKAAERKELAAEADELEAYQKRSAWIRSRVPQLRKAKPYDNKTGINEDWRDFIEKYRQERDNATKGDSDFFYPKPETIYNELKALQEENK